MEIIDFRGELLCDLGRVRVITYLIERRGRLWAGGLSSVDTVRRCVFGLIGKRSEAFALF